MLSLPTGKLAPELLANLIDSLPTEDRRLVLGPGVGEDAAVIDLGSADTLLAAKSDPITFASDEIGYYAVNVCANDLAVCGARPRFYLPTVLLPEATTEPEVRRICDQVGAACRALEITVAGGHTEVTEAVKQPVIAGTLLGEVTRCKVVRTGGCRPGDLILLAGGAAIEGTSIIAREMREGLLAQGWQPARLEEAANYLFEPGISVLAPALAAADAGDGNARPDGGRGRDRFVGDGRCVRLRAGGGAGQDSGRARDRGRVRRFWARSSGHDRVGRAAGDRRAGGCGAAACVVGEYG